MPGAVISIAQQKGGTGKTTLAAHLAVAWAIAGRRVALLDIDPQASLGFWIKLRRETLGEGNEGLTFAAVSGWRIAGEVERVAQGHDIVVVDCPPHAETEARLAMRAARLVLVPVQPTPLDLWATRPIIELAARDKVPSILVLNRVLPRTTLTAAAMSSLADLSSRVAGQSVGNRAAFPASMATGLTALETQPLSDAAEEIRLLAKELHAALG